MITVGRTSATGQFDAAVVFGARVYENGTPSDALQDRVLAACKLYKNNQTSILIFSGGPGNGSVSEPQAMRQLALDQGVPVHALILDEYGFNTTSTAINTAEIYKQHNWNRVVGVSHFFHTPRVKVALQREGLSASTQTAPMQGGIHKKLPIYLARESVAWWVYVFGLR